MGRSQPAADFQFLSDRQGQFRADDFQFLDTARLAPLHRNKVDDAAEVTAALLLDNVRQFFLCIAHLPTVEIRSRLVKTIQDLSQQRLVGGIAKSIGRGSYPLLGIGFLRQVEGDAPLRIITDRIQVRMASRILAPASREGFRRPAATLREAGVAYLVLRNQHFSPRRGYSGRSLGIGRLRYALVTLAMVVGTDVEEFVILAVVPA